MRRAFTKLAALVGLMAMTGTPASNAAVPVQQATSQANKDMDKKEIIPVRPAFKRNAFGGFGNESLKPAGRFLNQRQYRKKCRQNPCLYNSRKGR